MVEPPEHDLAHAEVLARLWSGRYRWADHRRTWMRWSGKRWAPATDHQAVAQATLDLRRNYGEHAAAAGTPETIRRLAGLLKETCLFVRMSRALDFLKGMDGFHTQHDAWDADPWLLNVANGTVNLRTGQLERHDPADLCTMLAPVDYDPAATGAAWAAHLERFLPHPDLRRQVQRDLGLALIGAPMAEMLPIWYGTGANGKSTTARAIQGVLGDYAIQAAPSLLVTRRHEQHPTEIADLCGSRAVFSVEITSGARLDEAKVKDLTGGDTKKARYMRGDFFQFQQTWNLFLLVNHKPTISGTDNGIWRRVRLVPWAATIPADEQRPQEEVLRELLADGPAVFRWLLDGLADWQHDPHWLAGQVSTATEEYRTSEDRLGGFLADCCEEGPYLAAPVGELYEAYASWCESAGEEPLGKNRFGKSLRERGLAQGRAPGSGRRLWLGLRLGAGGVTNRDTSSGSIHIEDVYSGEPETLSHFVTGDTIDAGGPAHPGGKAGDVSVNPWTDGPKRVAVNRGRVQELLDQGYTLAQAERVALYEAEEQAAAQGDEAPPC